MTAPVNVVRENTENAYRDDLEAAYAVGAQILVLPLQNMLRAIRHAETTAPLFNPTLYMQKAAAMEADKAVLEILATAHKKLEALGPRARDMMVAMALKQMQCMAGGDE